MSHYYAQAQGDISEEPLRKLSFLAKAEAAYQEAQDKVGLRKTQLRRKEFYPLITEAKTRLLADPWSSATAWYELGLLSKELKLPSVAYEAFEQANNIDPANAAIAAALHSEGQTAEEEEEEVNRDSGQQQQREKQQQQQQHLQGSKRSLSREMYPEGDKDSENKRAAAIIANERRARIAAEHRAEMLEERVIALETFRNDMPAGVKISDLEEKLAKAQVDLAQLESDNDEKEQQKRGLRAQLKRALEIVAQQERRVATAHADVCAAKVARSEAEERACFGSEEMDALRTLLAELQREQAKLDEAKAQALRRERERERILQPPPSTKSPTVPVVVAVSPSSSSISSPADASSSPASSSIQSSATKSPIIAYAQKVARQRHSTEGRLLDESRPRVTSTSRFTGKLGMRGTATGKFMGNLERTVAPTKQKLKGQLVVAAKAALTTRDLPPAPPSKQTSDATASAKQLQLLQLRHRDRDRRSSAPVRTGKSLKKEPERDGTGRRSESPRLFRRGGSFSKPVISEGRTESADSILFAKRKDSTANKARKSSALQVSASTNSYVSMTRQVTSPKASPTSFASVGKTSKIETSRTAEEATKLLKQRSVTKERQVPAAKSPGNSTSDSKTAGPLSAPRRSESPRLFRRGNTFFVATAKPKGVRTDSADSLLFAKRQRASKAAAGRKASSSAPRQISKSPTATCKAPAVGSYVEMMKSYERQK